MARKKIDGPSRQLFAKINEDVYLAAKSRAAQQRISMRALLENALTLYLSSDSPAIPNLENPELSGNIINIPARARNAFFNTVSFVKF